jgi:4-alpha-glucanotransferase
VFRERERFALDASVGAPPDSFFPQGQDWGFPPLRPGASRAQGHGHLAACLRHHLRHAGLLRVDHVMGLHRQFWIPRGLPKERGVYVRQPAEELHAVLCLEAARAGAAVVGENLGTVPAYVNRALARHRWLATYVVEYAARPRAADALPPVPRDAVASLNTHDMPPFSSFFAARDVPERIALGLLARERGPAERRARERVRRALVSFLRRRGLLGRRTRAADVVAAAHAHLAASPARLVLVNLEDLWGEAAPLNVPGTWREVPNWRRKFRRDLSRIRTAGDVARALDAVVRARRAR